MSAAELVPVTEQLEVDVVGAGGGQHAGDSAGVVHTEPIGTDGWIAMLATTSADDGSEPAIARDAIVREMRDSDDPDLAAVLKRAFRSANQALYADNETDPSEGVAAIAMRTSGKNASIALVGDHRGYLYRANRMTQLTRDQRVYRSTSRRSQDQERASQDANQEREALLLGVRDRLDSRTPAIFEITLLPEDKLALVSENVYSSLGDDEMERIVSSAASGAASALSANAGTMSPAEPALAAVLSVGPAREPRTDIRTYSGGGVPWLPAAIGLLAIVAVIVIIALLVI